MRGDREVEPLHPLHPLRLDKGDLGYRDLEQHHPLKLDSRHSSGDLGYQNLGVPEYRDQDKDKDPFRDRHMDNSQWPNQKTDCNNLQLWHWHFLEEEMLILWTDKRMI